MTSDGPAVTVRMHASTRLVVPGLLLALGAGTASAQATPAPAVVTPTAAPAPAPLNLALPTLPPASAPALAPMSAPAPTPAVAAPAEPPPISAEVQRVTHWIRESNNNAGMPFLVIDKANARVYAYTRSGQLQGDAPVLLGMTRGDKLLAPNSATMSVMGPNERITPAGRFVSRLSIDSHGKELLVLDYAAAISLHPVVKGKPYEHRAERLASPTSSDNRISFGCINAPIPFYETVVSPSFKGTKGIVYVLPETSPAAQLFGFQPYDAPISAAPASSTALMAAPAASADPAPVAN